VVYLKNRHLPLAIRELLTDIMEIGKTL